MRLSAVLFTAVALTACGEERKAEAPSPAMLTRAAVGYYDQMTVLDHEGPKAQIFVEARPIPFWFSSVRDAVVFTMLPEEPKDIRAIYVSDMARARTWADPGETWVEARAAHFVVGSVRMGGMGKPEPVPFSTAEAAEAFAREHGGQVVPFTSIPRGSILDDDAATPAEAGPAHHPNH